MLASLTAPNWLRVLGGLVTVLSFVPQLRRICSIKSSSGLSLYYILFPLILATEETAIFFLFLVNDTDGARSFISSPPSIGDWLNLCQVALVWILLLIGFVLAIYYQPHDRRLHRWIPVVIYTSFLLISLIPEICDAFFGTFKDENGRLDPWAMILFGGGHMLFILPTVTFLSPISVFFQARLIWERRALGLSISGLAVQTVVFTLNAALWLGRINYPDKPTMPISRVAFINWFTVSGWPAVDDMIFALIQGVLLCLALYKSRVKIQLDEGPVQD